MGLRRRLPHRRPKDSGQGLVEFALALPIFVLLLTGTIEFGFLYNNLLTVQFAARQGVTVAAEAGATDGADCAILNAVELGLSMPVDRSKVTEVEIFESNANGDPIPDRVNTYTRSGTLDCGTTTQPYSLVGAEGYPQTERKDNLADGLDVVGVRIAYQYTGITPIGSGHTWVLSDGATLRMEPKQ